MLAPTTNRPEGTQDDTRSDRRAGQRRCGSTTALLAKTGRLHRSRGGRPPGFVAWHDLRTRAWLRDPGPPDRWSMDRAETAVRRLAQCTELEVTAATGNQRPFYSVAEVAELLGMSDMTIYRAIRDGEF